YNRQIIRLTHGTAEDLAMDGLSRWDLVLWIVVGYAAVMALVRMMLNHRDAALRRLRDQVEAQPRRKPAAPVVEERREAANAAKLHAPNRVCIQLWCRNDSTSKPSAAR